ncbi:Chitotriosidase-1 [Arthrobotrys entomopaga]|nr:Chitotriosidase-1 [Arthrobotrys entomopaga]
MGLGFYGRSFALADPSCTQAGCMFTAGGAAGPCTDSVGTLSYGEIQRLITDGATPELDSVAAVKTLVYEGNNWVSYDDATTFQMKIDYANNNCLGGTMVWAVSLDDRQGTAASALANGAGASIPPMNLYVSAGDNPGLCKWSSCGGVCPSGFSSAIQVQDGCPEEIFRSFCCPVNDMAWCTPHYNTIAGRVDCSPIACSSGTTLLTTSRYFRTDFGYTSCDTYGLVNSND